MPFPTAPLPTATVAVPDLPEATATASAATFADTTITILTSDGSDIPDGASICLDTSCQVITQALGRAPGRVRFAGMILAAAPSGISVTFTQVTVGTHTVQIRNASDETLVEATIEVIGGAVNRFTITIPGTALLTPTPPAMTPESPATTEPPHAATPVIVATVPVVATMPVAASTGSVPHVTTLPMTGDGGNGAPGGIPWQWGIGITLVLLAIAASLRRRFARHA